MVDPSGLGANGRGKVIIGQARVMQPGNSRAVESRG
jgi:hypothetical protein